MSAQELIWTSAATQRDLLDRREVSALELTRAHLDRLDAVEPALFCQLHRMDEIALRQADVADERIRAGNVDHMTGITVTLKDCGRTLAGAGRYLPGQVQYRRVRDGLID